MVYARFTIVCCLIVVLFPSDVALAKQSKGSLIAVDTDWEFKRDPLEGDFGSEVYSRQPYDDEDVLKYFKVRNDRLYEDVKWTYDEYTKRLIDVDYTPVKNTDFEEYKVWDIFFRMSQAQFVKQNVARFVTFRDPADPRLAMVWRAKVSREPSWFLAVNVNAADFGNAKWERDMVITLMHEYAHIITLNKKQMKYSGNKKCSKYYHVNGLGCMFGISYLDKFAKRFWTQEELVRRDKINKLENYQDRNQSVLNYYTKNSDNYVTWYAAFSPEEDIAESFTNFLLLQRPTSTELMKNQKIRFFYEFPELVETRTRVRSIIEPYFSVK